MTHAPSHWLAIDAAFSGWSGYCRMAGTQPVEVLRWKCRDFVELRHWFLHPPGHLSGMLGMRHAPTLVVIEYPYQDKSAGTAIKLGRAVGFLEAVASSVGAEVELRRASQWRKQLKVSGTGQAAKDRVRSIIRGFATHPDFRPPVKGRHNRVYMPGLCGVGLRRSDEDRAEAAGCGIGYAIEQGWELPTV